MVHIFKESVAGYRGQPIQFQLLSHGEQGSSIAVMLPGKGYTVQGPLFHYSTGIFLNKGFDVLHVNYNYTVPQAGSNSIEEEIMQISSDVNSVFDYLANNHSYDNFTLIGKSLGTIALSAIADRLELSKAKIVWLTPLLQLDAVYEKMLTASQRGLCIIGDRDPYFISERFDRVAISENMQTLLIPNSNHSLDNPDHPIESIDILKKIINEISNL
ncbi:alpha/beta family hydrolase [Mesobacillus jeotgali]|uniref:alpha/beta family hydrolase n=1 Tax=Mesobacillus jeotgali TaxID=129985 RepID=UPI0009A667AE|nr:alpha/beta family hydrolase [Mesobacillus jeotgali]